MDGNPAHGLLGGQLLGGIVIELPAGDDVHVFTSAGEVEHQIAQNLTRRAKIGEEIAIEDNEALHQNNPVKFSTNLAFRRRARFPRFFLAGGICRILGWKQVVDLPGKPVG